MIALRCDLGVGVGLLGLQRDGRGFHSHLIGDLADFQLHIRTGDDVRADVGVRLQMRPETFGGHFEIIAAGQHIDHRVAPADIGGNLFRNSGAFTGDSHRGPGNHRVALISDRADDRAVEHLRYCGANGNRTTAPLTKTLRVEQTI